MSKMYCRKCGRELERNVRRCPCGSSVFTDRPREVLIPIDEELNEQIKSITRQYGLNVIEVFKAALTLVRAMLDLLSLLRKEDEK